MEIDKMITRSDLADPSSPNTLMKIFLMDASLIFSMASRIFSALAFAAASSLPWLQTMERPIVRGVYKKHEFFVVRHDFGQTTQNCFSFCRTTKFGLEDTKFVLGPRVNISPVCRLQWMKRMYMNFWYFVPRKIWQPCMTGPLT
jgi:hypothetical protein